MIHRPDLLKARKKKHLHVLAAESGIAEKVMNNHIKSSFYDHDLLMDKSWEPQNGDDNTAPSGIEEKCKLLDLTKKKAS